MKRWFAAVSVMLVIGVSQSWAVEPQYTKAGAGLSSYKILVGPKLNPIIQGARYDLGRGISVALAKINLQQSSVTLHPGSQVPGNLKLWGATNYISSTASSKVVAAFNSGFKLKDSRGGFYENGHTAGRIAVGVASFIIYKDGHVKIKPWPKGGVITPDVASIRQNIAPLIVGGVISKNINNNLFYDWGGTVSSVYTVWRSGVAVDGLGNLIYAAGNNLTPLDLVTALKAAGGVDAMELDINGGWVDFYYYTQKAGRGGLAAHKLTNFWSPTGRYLKGWSRDFFTISSK